MIYRVWDQNPGMDPHGFAGSSESLGGFMGYPIALSLKSRVQSKKLTGSMFCKLKTIPFFLAMDHLTEESLQR